MKGEIKCPETMVGIKLNCFESQETKHLVKYMSQHQPALNPLSAFFTFNHPATPTCHAVAPAFPPFTSTLFTRHPHSHCLLSAWWYLYQLIPSFPTRLLRVSSTHRMPAFVSACQFLLLWTVAWFFFSFFWTYAHLPFSFWISLPVYISACLLLTLACMQTLILLLCLWVMLLGVNLVY